MKKGKIIREDGIIPTLIFPLRKQVANYNQNELNDIYELKKLLPELEEKEEYEKCALIKNKLTNETH